MKNTPPHLPPKACNLKTHRTLQTVPALLFFVFIAALTSFALTLTTAVWFVPSFSPEQFVTKIQKNTQSVKADLDISVLNKTRQRIWRIYDKRQKVGDKYYRASETALQAVMFSSDGWAVAYDPAYKKGAEKYWEGMDYQGTSFKIDKVFVDSVSGLVYVKFSGEGFSFITFSNWKDVGEGSSVWQISSNEQKQHILEKPTETSVAQTYPIWQPQYFYHLKDVFGEGKIVIDDNGNMIGIIDDKQNLIEGWMVDSQYASILQKGEPDYKSVAWKGYMAYGYVREDDYTKRVSGFYVAGSPTFTTSNTVGVGDLIVKVQDRPVEAHALSRELLLAPEKFNVTVLRDGVEIDIIVKKASVVK